MRSTEVVICFDRQKDKRRGGEEKGKETIGKERKGKGKEREREKRKFANLPVSKVKLGASVFSAFL